MNEKRAAREAIDTNADALVSLSHRIHAHPELKWEEERSSEWLARWIHSLAGVP